MKNTIQKITSLKILNLKIWLVGSLFILCTKNDVFGQFYDGWFDIFNPYAVTKWPDTPFNNMGQKHSYRTSFDATYPSYDFGYRYVMGSGNGPGTGGGQFYSWYIGLGNEYPATGGGSYGAMFAVDRSITRPYLSVRYNENNSFSPWRRMASGYADVAGSFEGGTQLISTRANNNTTGGGQIYLNGGAGNRIDFNSNGVNPPSFGTRSNGTKIVLYPQVGTSEVDYAVGIQGGSLWHSVPTTGNAFIWYGGTTIGATLSGGGNFTTSGSITSGGIFRQNGNYRANGPNVQVGDAGYGFSSLNSTLLFYSGVNGYVFTNSAADGTERTNLLSIDNNGNLNARTGQITVTRQNDAATGGSQIYLNGGAGNRIDFNSNGVNPPSFGTRSNGTKIVLYPQVGTSEVDYAVGIQGGSLWHSVPTTGNTFIWYGGTTVSATLSGNGTFTANSIVKRGGTSSQFLKADGSVDNTTYLSTSSIANNLFNNMGQSNNTRSSFDATSPSYDFGFRYVTGSGNGPGTGGSQFYSWYIGLGNEYPATGGGSYGAMFAVDRSITRPYLSVRYNENNSFSSWRKMAAGFADVAGSVSSSTNWNAANGGGQIYLNGSTGNRIDFANVGFAAPTTSSRSVGTKIVLYPDMNGNNTDFAIGIEAGNTWFSVPSSTQGFKWYAGTKQLASLTGSGTLIVNGVNLDTITLATKAWRQKGVDSLNAVKLSKSDTASLSNRINAKFNSVDTVRLINSIKSLNVWTKNLGQIYTNDTVVIGAGNNIKPNKALPGTVLTVNGRVHIGKGGGLDSTWINYDTASFIKQLSLFVENGLITEDLGIAIARNDNWYWADFVFDDNYKLQPLEEVNKFIKINKHLPNIPSVDDIKKNGGYSVVKMNTLYLQKIEELTLYLIEQENKIKEQNQKISDLEDKFNELKSMLKNK